MSVISDAISVSAVSLAGDFQYISLFIEELTGQKRQIQLFGASMPLGSIDGGVEQNTAVTKYPGTSKTTIHVMGASEIPTTFKGHWSIEELTANPFILRSMTDGDEFVDSPSKARALFDSLCRSGQRVSVYWNAPNELSVPGLANMALPIAVIRKGIIKGAKWSEAKWSSIDWELSFEWDESDIQTTPVPLLPPSIPIGNLLSMINNIISQIDGLVDGILADINDVVDGVTGYLKMIETAVSDITELAGNIASLPADTANKVLGGLNGIKNTFDEMVVMSNQVATAYTSVGDTWNTLAPDKTLIDFIYGDKDEADGADQVGKAAAVSSLKQQLDEVQYELEKQIRNCQKIVEASAVQDVYVIAKAGDSFQKWAVQYGIKNWLTIALANGLWDDNVIPGETYRIPMAARS